MIKFKKAISLIAVGMMIVTLFTGCNKATDSTKVLNVYNVGDYIDESLIDKFEKETGIDVQYSTYDTNEMMYQKVKSGSTHYDLVFPSDYMVEKMKNEGLLEKLDFKNIPNMKYLDKSFLNPVYDKTNEYSVAYMWGTLGILYNKKEVKDPMDSWNILWNPKYKGNIMMFDSVRDTIGITLKKLGYSMNSVNPKEINEAKNLLMKQKDLVLAYVNDEGKDRLLGGEVDALTIAAKAGQDKQPIILTDKDSITDNTYKWLKSEDLQNAYFIGGPQMISTNVINKVNGITKDSVTNNRVYGADRHETNANVIKKFYTDDELEAVLVAKSDVLVDALAAGPLAANLKSPILITPKTYVSAYHKDNLEAKSANKVYKIGGGLTSKVMSSIASSLSKHNTTPTEPGNSGGKTVMIDPGHGGSAPGNSSGGMIEKDYNLNTSLATTEYLRSKGFNVIMTRDTDKTLSLGNRTALSNSLKPDLFTSIHYNGSTNKQGHGVEVFYKLKDKNGGTTKTVATNILNRILEKFKLTNRGIKTRVLPSDSTKDYLYVLRSNDMPAVLVECAFLDNENDMSLINSSAKVKEMGTQIGKGIEDSLK